MVEAALNRSDDLLYLRATTTKQHCIELPTTSPCLDEPCGNRIAVLQQWSIPTGWKFPRLSRYYHLACTHSLVGLVERELALEGGAEMSADLLKRTGSSKVVRVQAGWNGHELAQYRYVDRVVPQVDHCNLPVEQRWVTDNLTVVIQGSSIDYAERLRNNPNARVATVRRAQVLA
jgi:hypothetical protein